MDGTCAGWREKQLKRLKEKCRMFLKDRNGADDLGIFLTALSLINFLGGLLLKSMPITLAGALLLAWTFFREFSRNTAARKAENQRFLGVWEHRRFRRQSRKLRRQARKSYKYLKCRYCRKTIRIPKGKGEQSVLCPHCQKRYTYKE